VIRRIALLCLALSVPAFAQTTLNGAGATFPYPMYSKWFSKYHDAHPDIQFNYQSIGSGGGIQQPDRKGQRPGTRAAPHWRQGGARAGASFRDRPS